MKKLINLIKRDFSKGNLLFGLILGLIVLLQVKAYAADNDILQIGASLAGYHSGIVKNDGSLLMWGANEDGQLGINNVLYEGSGDIEVNPRLILNNAKFISFGNDTSALIKSDNSLWMTGNNEYGQLGDGTTINKSNFNKVMDNVSYVSIGFQHVLAVKKDGSLWAWGNNEYGQFCNGTKNGSKTPVKIMNDVKTVYAGGFHTAIIKKDGSLFMCGFNGDGQLGIGHYSDTTNYVEVNPQELNFFDDEGKQIKVREISPGYETTLFLLEDDTLWLSGGDYQDQYGDTCLGDDFYNSSTPVLVYKDVRLARKSIYFTAFIKNNGDLYMCGLNNYGQLGLGNQIEITNVPTKVMSNVKDIQTGLSHSIALKNNGSIYSWGENENGQLGLGYVSDVVYTPKKVYIPKVFIPIPEGRILEYNGQTQTGVDRGTGYTITGNTASRVGTYKAVLKLSQNYAWIDGTTENKEVEWKIVRSGDSLYVLNIPVGLTLEFNGKKQVGVEGGTGYTITGNTGIKVGNYKATLKLLQNYMWSDGTTENKEVEWKIVKSNNSLYIIKVPVGKTLKFNGEKQVGVESGTGYTITGNTGTRVGNYKATLKLLQNYEWSDGTTGIREVEWNIVTAYVVDFPKGQTLEYNGKTQIGVERGTGYTITGNSGKKVGKYKAILKLASNGYGWLDGTTGNKEINWEIVKATNPLTVTKKKVKIKFTRLVKRGAVVPRKDVLAIDQYKGTLSFSKKSGNAKIAIDKKSGAVKISKGLVKGKYAVTIKVTASGDNDYKAGDKVVKVRIIVR